MKMNDLKGMLAEVKKIKIGYGIQNILDRAYRILGNPIAMFNTEYNLLAYTEVTTDDLLWNELITRGTFSEEAQKMFENEGFIEEVANTPSITLLRSDKIKYDRINGKIFYKSNSYVSNLIIVACNKPFEEGDSMVFEIICKLISKEISKNETFQEYEQAHQETLIQRLIDNEYEINLEVAQVGILYDSLASNLYVAVVDVSQCSPENQDITYFRNLFKKIKPAYKYAIYSKYIMMLMSTNDDVFQAKKELKEFNTIFEQNHIYAGISSRFENLFDLQKYYKEAVNMLQYVLDCKSDQRIFPCNESSIHKLEEIKKVKNGEGIQYFLNIGPKIFGNPLLFHDMELNLLAYSKNIEIKDPIWEELITYGTSSDKTINLFRTEGYISTMENTKGGAFLTSDKIEYDRISWRIYSKDNIMIGCLSIVNSSRPFTDDELVLFGTFSQKFSKEVSKIEFYNNYGQVYSETVINRLLSGKIDDYTFYSEDIGNLYDDLMSNLYLVVIDTTQCHSEQINLTYFRDLFNWPNVMNRYAIYAGNIVIIISTDMLLNEDNELDKINQLFLQNNLYAGISSCCDDMHHLQTYYIEAVSALNNGIKNSRQDSKERIFQYKKPTGPDS